MRIFKRLPWDIRFTGYGTMLVMFPIHTLLSYYFLLRVDTTIPYVIYASMMGGFTVLVVWVAFRSGPPIWTHFVGTKVTFTKASRLVRAHELVYENQLSWTKDVCDVTNINGKTMTMLFRRKDHALLVKLAA